MHVGIYLGQGRVAESTTNGVVKTGLKKFRSRYSYVAVTRCPGVYGIPNLASKVCEFCADQINNCTKYDYFGAALSPLFEYLELRYQRLKYRPSRMRWPRCKTRTFCSQFVIDAYVAGGYIFDDYTSSGARSPTALAEENIFEFVGYLSAAKSLLPLVNNDQFWSGGV